MRQPRDALPHGIRYAGSSNVPLGVASLTENLMMVAMAVWMTAT